MREHLGAGLWLWAPDGPAQAPAGPDHPTLPQHPRKELHCPFVFLSINELFTVLSWEMTSPAVELLVSVGRGGDEKPAWIPKHGRENVTQLRSDCLLMENQYPRERQMLVERTVAYNQNASSVWKRWTQCHPKDIFKDSAWPWRFFKGTNGLDRGSEFAISHCM